MSFINKSQEYNYKFLELQEKLKKSEEERLRLEIKFNEMVQCGREEEKQYYKRLKHQYKHFVESEKNRMQRNEHILQALERIEMKISMLSAKTGRLKLLRQEYHSFLHRTYGKSFNDQKNSNFMTNNFQNQYTDRTNDPLPQDYVNVQEKLTSFNRDMKVTPLHSFVQDSSNSNKNYLNPAEYEGYREDLERVQRAKTSCRYDLNKDTSFAEKRNYSQNYQTQQTNYASDENHHQSNPEKKLSDGGKSVMENSEGNTSIHPEQDCNTKQIDEVNIEDNYTFNEDSETMGNVFTAGEIRKICEPDSIEKIEPKHKELNSLSNVELKKQGKIADLNSIQNVAKIENEQISLEAENNTELLIKNDPNPIELELEEQINHQNNFVMSEENAQQEKEPEYLNTDVIEFQSDLSNSKEIIEETKNEEIKEQETLQENTEEPVAQFEDEEIVDSHKVPPVGIVDENILIDETSDEKNIEQSMTELKNVEEKINDTMTKENVGIEIERDEKIEEIHYQENSECQDQLSLNNFSQSRQNSQPDYEQNHINSEEQVSENIEDSTMPTFRKNKNQSPSKNQNTPKYPFYDQNGQPINYPNPQQAQYQYDEKGQPYLQQYPESQQQYSESQQQQNYVQYDDKGRSYVHYDQNAQQYDENGQPYDQQYYNENDPNYANYQQPQEQYDEQHQQQYDQYNQQNYQNAQQADQQEYDQEQYDTNAQYGTYYAGVEYNQNAFYPADEKQEVPPDDADDNRTKLLDMLETDTENSSKQDLQVSNDSDFDLSRN